MFYLTIFLKDKINLDPCLEDRCDENESYGQVHQNRNKTGFGS